MKWEKTIITLEDVFAAEKTLVKFRYRNAAIVSIMGIVVVGDLHASIVKFMQKSKWKGTAGDLIDAINDGSRSPTRRPYELVMYAKLGLPRDLRSLLTLNMLTRGVRSYLKDIIRVIAEEKIIQQKPRYFQPFYRAARDISQWSSRRWRELKRYGRSRTREIWGRIRKRIDKHLNVY